MSSAEAPNDVFINREKRDGYASAELSRSNQRSLPVKCGRFSLTPYGVSRTVSINSEITPSLISTISGTILLTRMIRSTTANNKPICHDAGESTKTVPLTQKRLRILFPCPFYSGRAATTRRLRYPPSGLSSSQVISSKEFS